MCTDLARVLVPVEVEPLPPLGVYCPRDGLCLGLLPPEGDLAVRVGGGPARVQGHQLGGLGLREKRRYVEIGTFE